jgi:hypothetical protein
MMDPHPVAATSPDKINWRLVARGLLVFVLLGLCGFGLVALPFWKQQSLGYWMWMVPCFGVLSILLCMLTGSRRQMAPLKVLQNQLLHWVGTVAAIYLVFWLIRQQVLNVEAAGPAATIIMALSIYLAGISFDWQLIAVALLLGAMAVGAVFLERVLLVALGILVILVIAFFLLRPVIRNFRSTDTPRVPPRGV